MSRPGLFVDYSLAASIESTDAWVGLESVRIHRQLHPTSGATSLSIPGGYALFTGIGSPLTQVLGLGMGNRVRELDIEDMEEFYRTRGASVSVELCPFTERSTLQLLGPRGYAIAGFGNMLVRKLEPPVPVFSPGQFTVEPCTSTDGELWARTILGGFSGQRSDNEDNLSALLSLFHQPGSVCLLARVDGEPAGAGALSVHERVAAMYGASTLPRFRRRGVQTALIHALVAEASDGACNVIYTLTEPGSVSHRNLERQEFRLAYTRVTVRKTFP
jgi:GNAT superfamily N-acetyltransferase